MKTKIGKFKPTLTNLMLMDTVLRQAIRNGYRNRNKAVLSCYKSWNREDVRYAIKAYRMINATEVSNVD
jgi:hypothetical protein